MAVPGRARRDGPAGGPAHAFLPVDDPLDGTRENGEGDQDDLEDKHLRLLYRAERRYAVGGNVAVHAEVVPDERRATELRTTWLPFHDVPATAAPVGKGTRLADVELSMDALAQASREALAAGLAPLADGYERHRATTTVESVWTGPATHAVPVRATAQVLIDVAGESSHELVLMTYSAAPYQPLLDALAQALERGVSVMVVVETLRGAGSALSGAEPVHAFTGLLGVEVWHWPVGERGAGRRCTPSSWSSTSGSCWCPAPT